MGPHHVAPRHGSTTHAGNHNLAVHMQLIPALCSHAADDKSRDKHLHAPCDKVHGDTHACEGEHCCPMAGTLPTHGGPVTINMECKEAQLMCCVHSQGKDAYARGLWRDSCDDQSTRSSTRYILDPMVCLMQLCSTTYRYNMQSSIQFTTLITGSCVQDFGLCVQRCTAAAALGTSCCCIKVSCRST
jgi:hypothetical protein